MKREEYERHLANLWKKRMEAKNEVSQRFWSKLIRKIKFEYENGII